LVTLAFIHRFDFVLPVCYCFARGGLSKLINSCSPILQTMLEKRVKQWQKQWMLEGEQIGELRGKLEGKLETVQGLILHGVKLESLLPLPALAAKSWKSCVRRWRVDEWSLRSASIDN